MNIRGFLLKRYNFAFQDLNPLFKTISLEFKLLNKKLVRLYRQTLYSASNICERGYEPARVKHLSVVHSKRRPTNIRLGRKRTVVNNGEKVLWLWVLIAWHIFILWEVFKRCWDISSTCLFANLPFRQLAFSLTCLFINQQKYVTMTARSISGWEDGSQPS